jgi:membrane-associated phospholipid phosphatase
MKLFMTIFNNIGSYSSFYVWALSIYLLCDKQKLLFYYVIGFFVNVLLNLVLKGIIQQPRPTDDINIFNLAVGNGKRFIFKDGIPYDVFGMPSGHAQTVLFSTAFVYFALRNNKILYIYLLISLITMGQRVVFNHHTISQVFIGAIAGSFFGYFVYYLCKENIRGHITEKKDDYGPI